MICDICGKVSKFEGLCWYSGDLETHLCRSHYMKWNRHHKSYVDSHKHIKSCTKEWKKMCREEQILFVKWKIEETESKGDEKDGIDS